LGPKKLTEKEIKQKRAEITTLRAKQTKPIKEEITLLEENKSIEYKLIDNPLIKHHLGRIEFSEITPYITLVTYRIELTAKAPVVSKLILAQLKLAITLGFSRLAKAVAS
jgi:hypothetical protein